MEKLKKINIILLVFIAFMVRLIVLGAGWGDAFALIALSGLIGLQLYLNKEKQLKVNEFSAEIKRLNDSIQALEVKNSIRRQNVQQKERVRNF